MHDSVRAFVVRVVDQYDLAGAVLEVGSLDVNGGIRDLFGETYLGVDIQAGPGVDRVIDDSFYDRQRYDVVVSCEMLEHDPRPWVTLQHFARVLQPDGWLVLTARGFGPDQGSTGQWRTYGPHDFPADYWRFSEVGMAVMLTDAGFTIVESGPDPDPQAPGVFVVARR